MNESLLQQAHAMAGEVESVRASGHVVFDGRHPKLVDHQRHVLQITTGHVDVFARRVTGANASGARHHLFRAENGEIILPLQDAFSVSGIDIEVIAVGSPGSEALLLRQQDFRSRQHMDRPACQLDLGLESELGHARGGERFRDRNSTGRTTPWPGTQHCLGLSGGGHSEIHGARSKD